MKIGIPREAAGERRVAMTPDVTRRLVEAGHDVVIAAGLGIHAGFADDAYADAGAEIGADPWSDADLVMVVGPPQPERAARVPVGAALVGFLDPFASEDLVATLARRRVTAFAMEAIPRTTLAQSMDALSSQASAAGYQAVLLAAAVSPRFFPMMITAAGTIPPAKLLSLIHI